MGRPREFERDVVLDRAMQVFWSRGYEATSIRHLVDRMRIRRGSLYDTHVMVTSRIVQPSSLGASV